MSTAIISFAWNRFVVGQALAAALEGRLLAVPIEVDASLPAGRLVVKGSLGVNGNAKPFEAVLERRDDGWHRVEANLSEPDLLIENDAVRLALSVIDL